MFSKAFGANVEIAIKYTKFPLNSTQLTVFYIPLVKKKQFLDPLELKPHKPV